MIAPTRSRRSNAGPAQHRLAWLSRSSRAYVVTAPSSPLLADAMPHADWSDAYAVDIPADASRRDPQEWADAVFHAPPLWIQFLFGVRELLVRAMDIERADEHVFDTVARADEEAVLGVDQTHLGFRASVLVERHRVVVTTVVRFHNRRGAAYFALVRRVHPLIVRSMLARAARALASPTTTAPESCAGASTDQPNPGGFGVPAGASPCPPFSGAQSQEN
jgi:hypothetical protein